MGAYLSRLNDSSGAIMKTEACSQGYCSKGCLVAYVILFLVIASSAWADFLLIGKDGHEFKWTDYFDEGENYCKPMEGGKFCLPKAEIISIKEIEGSHNHQAEDRTTYDLSTKAGITAYVATDLKGNEYLWPSYVNEGDNYCVPMDGETYCMFKKQFTSIRKVAGIRSKNFDRPPYSAIIKGSADKKRSPAEEALDDYEEEYPERTESIPEPSHNDFSLIGAGKLCRYAVLNMSIYVKTAERTNILPYKDKLGRYGYRFCFKTRSLAPGEKIGLLRNMLCSIYKVGDQWQYELKNECSFMQ